MHNWDDLRFCLALDRHKTMTKAAESLSANVATVSRRIEKLTEETGQTLFIKHANMWEPTAAGRRLVSLAEIIEGNLDAFAAQQGVTPPPGTVVRVAMSLTVLQSVLGGTSALFMERHPDLVLDLTFRERSIAYAEADIAVTYVRPTQGLLTCRKLGEIRVRPYVASGLEGPPAGWVCIDYNDADAQVSAYARSQHSGPVRLRMEGLNLAHQVVANSELVAIFPECYGDSRNDLRRLTPDGPAESLEVWISFHRSRKLDPIVRLADKLLTDCFSMELGG